MAKRTDDKGRILRTGESQRPDGRYMYRYNDYFGKRKTVYALTLAELREKEKDIQRDLEDGIDRAGSEMTLNQLFDLYMNTKTNLRESSKNQYWETWRRHVASSGIGEKRIRDIKATHICALYADFSRRGLCEGTIRGVHKLLKASLEFAVDSDMIRKNPTKNCTKYITGGKHNRDGLTREEEANFLQFVRDNDSFKLHEPMITFFLNTGLRASELCGLTWENIDMKKNIIHVRQQLMYLDYGDGIKYHASDLKTEKSERDVPLTHEARKALLNQRQLELVLGIQKNTVQGLSNFVFTNTKGNPWTANAIDGILDRIVKRYNSEREEGMPEMRKISAHILRHTFASRCAEAGMDAKTLQIILGHSNISTTMNIYVQMDEEEVQKKFHEAEQGMKVI